MSEARDTETPPFLERLGASVLDTLQILGECVSVAGAAAWRCRTIVRHREKVLAQLVRIGTESLVIAAMVSLFVGMVMVVQAAEQLASYTQEILGSLVGLAMTKELGPVVMGFLIAGRSGSAIAAEIGSMKVSDEIAALRTMDIDPIAFLAMPRLVATTLALPMLVLYADFVGILGGALVVTFDPTIQISAAEYFENLLDWINFQDILTGLAKGAAFGAIIASVACAFGFRTSGGSEGVAHSTTSAVVWSSVLIVVADYLIVRLAFLFFPSGVPR